MTIHADSKIEGSTEDNFAAEVRANQLARRATLLKEYDYIVCGAGTAGSVVAARLAADQSVMVLLLEAGGNDESPSVLQSTNWPHNFGTERDWAFVAAPNPHLDGRSMSLPMGKGLGGGSSINAMIWARGHKSDWDYFAAESGDAAWNYQSALNTYRRIEDWQGAPDVARRGTGGLIYVEPAADPHPAMHVMLAAAARHGIPTFADHNAEPMEGSGGGSLFNLTLRDGKRASIFRSYVYPLMAQPNLTVLTHANVLRVLIDGGKALGVEVTLDGEKICFAARRETILSLGAVNTPKLLLLSGIGDAEQLRSHGIDFVQDLPGVGQNFQDHIMAAGCLWESAEPLPPRNNLGAGTLFWRSSEDLETPDIQTIVAEIPLATAEAQAGYEVPASAWSLLPALVRPKSRGQVTLTGANPSQPVRIETNALSEPEDLKALVRALELCREIGNDSAMTPFTKREVMPGNLTGTALTQFVRAAATTLWHQAGTAKMGTDRMSVVDAELRVFGIESLRIADASIMPRVTTGNTMAPCVVIGERLAALLTGRR